MNFESLVDLFKSVGVFKSQKDIKFLKFNLIFLKNILIILF